VGIKRRLHIAYTACGGGDLRAVLVWCSFTLTWQNAGASPAGALPAWADRAYSDRRPCPRRLAFRLLTCGAEAYLARGVVSDMDSCSGLSPCDGGDRAPWWRGGAARRALSADATEPR